MVILCVILALIALAFIIAALVGTASNFEKSININAPVKKVRGNINSVHSLNSWNRWVSKDPYIKIESDCTNCAGFTGSGTMKNVGEGKRIIIRVTDNSELLLRLDFLKSFSGKGDAFMRIAS